MAPTKAENASAPPTQGLPARKVSAANRVTKPAPKPKPVAKPKPKPAAKKQPAETEWRPPATQKTELERSISQIGAAVPKKLRFSFSASTKRDKRVLDGGPKGDPVLDRLGYKISYTRLSKSQRLPPKRISMRALTKEMEEGRRIEGMMGMDRNKISAFTLMCFCDQVARDLDIPYHTVKIAEYEEWHRRGFTADPGLWENPSAEERARIEALTAGSAFRE